VRRPGLSRTIESVLAERRDAPRREWQTEKFQTDKVEAHCLIETMGGEMVVAE
jgi:hypothetical protein